jgi:hypothetical protein
MKFPDPATLRIHAQQLRRQELARIAEAGAIEWSTLIRRIRALLSRPTCPAPARNPRPA